MMEGASNGGMLYHEVQESKLCAVHCVNTVLQGPFFSEFDLAALASDLDRTERQMMMLPALSSSGDFLSHNVSLDGDFSIQGQARHACDARFWLGDVSYICCSLPNPEASIAGNGVTTLMCRLVHRSRYVIKYDQQYVPEQSKQVGFDTVYQHPFICPIATRDSTLVLQKALEVWDLQVIPLDSPVAEPAQIDPELENAFICHLQDHWFCIRKVNGEWYNFDSLYAAPQHLSKFYLAAYLDSLKGFGWSIFLVRGNFPKEFPISSSEASNGFGQWLSPEDAERITKSCNSVQAPQGRINENQDRLNQQFPSHDEAEMFSDMEDEDLKAAIAASLMDSSPAVTNAEAGAPQNDKQSSKQVATTEATPLSDQQNKQLEPIEASLPPSDQSNKDEAAIEAGSLLNDKNNQEVASPVDGKPQSENQNK